MLVSTAFLYESGILNGRSRFDEEKKEKKNRGKLAIYHLPKPNFWIPWMRASSSSAVQSTMRFSFIVVLLSKVPFRLGLVSNGPYLLPSTTVLGCRGSE